MVASPPQNSLLVEHPNLPTRKALRVVLGLPTVMILKGVSESVSFQSNNFLACKVKDVVNFLMVFNLLKITNPSIHPFYGKKHLRTYSNLNWNTKEYLIGYN